MTFEQDYTEDYRNSREIWEEERKRRQYGIFFPGVTGGFL